MVEAYTGNNKMHILVDQNKDELRTIWISEASRYKSGFIFPRECNRMKFMRDTTT